MSKSSKPRLPTLNQVYVGQGTGQDRCKRPITKNKSSKNNIFKLFSWCSAGAGKDQSEIFEHYTVAVKKSSDSARGRVTLTETLPIAAHRRNFSPPAYIGSRDSAFKPPVIPMSPLHRSILEERIKQQKASSAKGPHEADSVVAARLISARKCLDYEEKRPYGEFHATPVKDGPSIPKLDFHDPTELEFLEWQRRGQRVPYTGNFGRDSARGPCQPKRENDWALAESSRISQENKKDVVTDQTDLEEDYTDHDRGNTRETLLISKYDRKRDWYSGFAHGCSRKESFAFKNRDWFGGAGSVRNLVQHYESRRNAKLNGRTSERNAVSMTEVTHGRIRSKPSEYQTTTATATAPFTSTDSASASSDKDLDRWLENIFPTLSERTNDFPILPPPLIFASPTAPPLIPADKFPMMPPPSPPPPPTPSDFAGFSKFADFPPPPPSDQLLCRSAQHVDSTESQEQNEDSSPMPNDSFSSPFTHSMSPNRGAFSPPVETYFTANGEGPNMAGQQVDKSENSDRSRMGDFKAVEIAVERMSMRLKQPRLVSQSTRGKRLAPVPPARPIPPSSEDLPVMPDLKETCVQVSRHGAKSTTLLHQPKVGSGNRKEELDEFHDQLDHILLNGDEEVTYSRFQDPFPLYDSTVKPTTTSTRRALNHVVPADELLLNSNSRSRNKKMAAADLYGTRRQSLRFDSLTSGSSNCTSSSSKNTSHLVRRTRGDVFENKRGEIIFSVDARSGYEFSSTISLRTSDLSKYSVSQTKKEIRTGKTVTERYEVFGSGVKQQIRIDRPRLSGRRCYQLGSQSLDDSLPSLSYDYQSDASDAL